MSEFLREEEDDMIYDPLVEKALVLQDIQTQLAMEEARMERGEVAQSHWMLILSMPETSHILTASGSETYAELSFELCVQGGEYERVQLVALDHPDAMEGMVVRDTEERTAC